MPIRTLVITHRNERNGAASGHHVGQLAIPLFNGVELDDVWVVSKRFGFDCDCIGFGLSAKSSRFSDTACFFDALLRLGFGLSHFVFSQKGSLSCFDLGVD